MIQKSSNFLSFENFEPGEKGVWSAMEKKEDVSSENVKSVDALAVSMRSECRISSTVSFGLRQALGPNCVP